jgi:hypothetical protein
MKLWPRRKSIEPTSSPELPGQPELLDSNHGVEVEYMDIDELGNTTTSLSLKEIIRAKEEMAAAKQGKP